MCQFLAKALWGLANFWEPSDLQHEKIVPPIETSAWISEWETQGGKTWLWPAAQSQVMRPAELGQGEAGLQLTHRTAVRES